MAAGLLTVFALLALLSLDPLAARSLAGERRAWRSMGHDLRALGTRQAKLDLRKEPGPLLVEAHRVRESLTSEVRARLAEIRRTLRGMEPDARLQSTVGAWNDELVFDRMTPSLEHARALLGDPRSASELGRLVHSPEDVDAICDLGTLLVLEALLAKRRRETAEHGLESTWQLAHFAGGNARSFPVRIALLEQAAGASLAFPELRHAWSEGWASLDLRRELQNVLAGHAAALHHDIRRAERWWRTPGQHTEVLLYVASASRTLREAHLALDLSPAGCWPKAESRQSRMAGVWVDDLYEDEAQLQWLQQSARLDGLIAVLAAVAEAEGRVQSEDVALCPAPICGGLQGWCARCECHCTPVGSGTVQVCLRPFDGGSSVRCWWVAQDDRLRP